MEKATHFDISEELKKLPDKPGVYLMHDEKDTIIYVGKAVNLKNRVRSYFREKINRGPKIDKMVSLINRFEYIVTDSELEALVLENNLIKEHRPKYNTMLMDDKTYPYIKVTMWEEYPRVIFSREMKKDKAKYFGPYTSAAAVKDTIELLNKLYQLRTCHRSLPKEIGNERPCLNYHIHQCKAPCQSMISPEEYKIQVDEALEFLNGSYGKILKELQQKMETASENLEFEEAASYRDLWNSVKQVAQKQKITDSEGEDRDVIAYSQLGIGRLIYQLPIPLCKMFIKEIFDGRSPDDFDEEILSTITKFFENSLNVSETSRQLYIHRNTLVYRLDKLQKSTGLDLRVFEDAITFRIALMVVKYMKYMESLDY